MPGAGAPLGPHICSAILIFPCFQGEFARPGSRSQTYQETFTNIWAKSPLGGGMLLDNLASVLTSLHTIPLKQSGQISLEDGKGALADLQNCGGLELGWLTSHMERMHKSRRAFKVLRRVELKRREVERAQARVDIACTALAQRETVLRKGRPSWRLPCSRKKN